MITKLFLCFTELSVKRYDHAKGTLIVRPSSRVAEITSSVTATALILFIIDSSVHRVESGYDFVIVCMRAYPDPLNPARSINSNCTITFAWSH